jgi:hypothetical protein
MPQVDTVRPLKVAKEDGETTTVTNVGTEVVYYATNSLVSPTSNEGSLTAGQSLTLSQTTWFIATVKGAQVEIYAKPTGVTSIEVIAAGAATVGSDGTVGGPGGSPLSPSAVSSSAANTFVAGKTQTFLGPTRFGSTSSTEGERVPFASSQTLTAGGSGTGDHIAHELQSLVKGEWKETTGSDPNWAWGLDVFHTTGNEAGDANGLERMENLVETAVRAPAGTHIHEVIGLMGQADFFGATAGATVDIMIGVRAEAPLRNAGATAGTATTAYSLYVGKATTTAVSATSAASIFVQGGTSELNGNVAILNETKTVTPLVIQMAPEQEAVPFKINNALGAQVYRITKEGGIGASNSVIAFEGQSRQSLIGFAGPTGQAGLALGETSDVRLYRIGASQAGLTTPLFIAETTLPGAHEGYGGVWNQLVGGRDYLSVVQGNGGAPAPLGDRTLWGKSWVLITPSSKSGQRIQGTGQTSNTGTFSLVQATTALPQLLQIATAATAGAIADVATSGGEGMQVFIGAEGNPYSGFDYHAELSFPDASYNETGALTGSRIFAGLTSSVGTMFGADRGGAAQLAAFCCSNVAGGELDTNFQFVTNTGAAVTTVSTGIARTTGHLYRFHIWCPAGSTKIYWQIDDVTAATTASGTATEHLPTATTALFAVAGVSTVDAKERKFGFREVYLGTDKG